MGSFDFQANALTTYTHKHAHVHTHIHMHTCTHTHARMHARHTHVHTHTTAPSNGCRQIWRGGITTWLVYIKYQLGRCVLESGDVKKQYKHNYQHARYIKKLNKIYIFNIQVLVTLVQYMYLNKLSSYQYQASMLNFCAHQAQNIIEFITK